MGCLQHTTNTNPSPYRIRYFELSITKILEPRLTYMQPYILPISEKNNML